jgi:cystathionine beta-lyase/cystathionine gamma-synthase
LKIEKQNKKKQGDAFYGMRLLSVFSAYRRETKPADQGIKPNTIRLSIGTEPIDELLSDLPNGFDAVQA